MADHLARVWQLVVLKVRLDLARREPVIASQIVAHPDGAEVVLWSREDPLEAFGLPRGSSPPSRLRVPVAVSAAVNRVVHEHRDPDDDAPVLWLRLVPPYGYLGAVPWEDLTATIGMPLLRIPDRLPVPVDFGAGWSSALMISAPHRATWGAEHVVARAEALRRELGMPWRVDVFTDAHTFGLLTDVPGVLPPPWTRARSDRSGAVRLVTDPGAVPRGDVRLHDPAGAVPAHHERGWHRRRRTAAGHRPVRPLQDANLVWSDWIITALAGRAVRALHVVAQGALDGDHPVILFSADPGDALHEPWATATDDELCLLADVLGASLISFTSPYAARPDLAIRMLADTIGQSRPGPTLYSSLRLDPSCEALAAAEAFVADPGSSVPVPQHRSLFGYIQPESLHPDRRPGWSRAASRTVYGSGVLGVDEDPAAEPAWAGSASRAAPPPPPPSALAPPPAPAPAPPAPPPPPAGDPSAVPAWVASSARFIDTHRAALMTAAAAPGEPPSTQKAYEEGVASALADIEDLVRRRSGGWS